MGDTDYERGNHVALISGGMDSAVAAHVAIEDGPADLLVYLDTGTGLDENERVRERAENDDAQKLLCSTCRTDYPTATDGGNVRSRDTDT